MDSSGSLQDAEEKIIQVKQYLKVNKQMMN